jgi:recombination protein RecA
MAERKVSKPSGKVENLDALSQFARELKKDFKGTLYIPGKDEIPSEIKGFVSTGSTILDVIISNRRNGGIPIGRITEISGTESTGKSLLAYHVIKSTQEMGGIPLLIDTEKSTDFELLARLGIDLSEGKFFYADPNTVESVFQLMEGFLDLANKNGFGDKLITIIWDSVAATSNEQEQEKDYGEATMAVNARLISTAIRKMENYTKKMKVCMLFINQLKHNIGANMPGANKWTTPGGMAIRYHASVRVQLTKDKKIKKKLPNGDEESVGVGARAEIVKNKVAPPFRKCVFDIYFNFGIDDLDSLVPYLIRAKVLKEKNTQVYIVTNEVGEDLEIKKREWRTQVRKDRKLYSYLKTKAVDEIILDFGIREDTSALAVEEEDFSVFEKEEDYEDKVLTQTSPVIEPLEMSKPKKEKKRAKDLSEFSAKSDQDEEESDLAEE